MFFCSNVINFGVVTALKLGGPCTKCTTTTINESAKLSSVVAVRRRAVKRVRNYGLAGRQKRLDSYD
jgi:hypothetical protein